MALRIGNCRRPGWKPPLDDIVSIMKTPCMSIDQYLHEQKLTLSALARMAGVSKARLSQVRSGKRPASARIIRELYRVTEGKVTPADLGAIPADRAA